ncbi:MAG: hypothetical protein ACI37S_05210 [Candidatus Gastranaerophilaceae bacterium]
MRQLILGLALGIVIGLTCTGCSLAKAFISAEPMQVVLTERGHITTTKVKTEEGTYRIFTIENTNGNGGVGISAVRVE